jgi:hypothetical protein
MLTSKALTSAAILVVLSHLGTGAGTVAAGMGGSFPTSSSGVAPSIPNQASRPDAPAPLDVNFNGIVAGEPKIYDDRSLEQMLQAYESQLAQLRAFDNSTLVSRIGTLQGATSQQSSFAAQATARPTPDLTSTVTTGTDPGTQTLSKQPSITPAVPGITDSGAGALPNSYSTSASDALGEEAQLAFEIANLRLLLQESLSDRYVNGSDLPKRSVTIGIPISIEPIIGSEGAVAEVEISFTTAGPSHENIKTCDSKATAPATSCSQLAPPIEGSPSPGVITLLPREKTYNVAAIKDSSTSLGAGAVVANVINVGLNWMGRKQSYYIVKATDTVAMQRATQQPATTVLAWQFLPVLGEKTVKPGLRQVFVRLSFQINGVGAELGTVRVGTTWRHYDQKSGIVGSPKCMKTWARCYPLIDVARFAKGSLAWSDLGTGQVAIVDSGPFPPGTSVLLPEGYIADGSPNFQLDSKHIMFNLSGAQLVRERVGSLVSIFGNECELKTTECSPKLQHAKAKIHRVTVQPYNASQSKVTVELEDGDVTDYTKAPPLVLLGKHVIGLRDAPFYEVQAQHVNDEGFADSQDSSFKKWEALSFLATNDDLRQAHSLELAHPFCGSHFYDRYSFDLPGDFIAAQATTLSTSDAGNIIAISGQNLTDVFVLVNGIRAEQATTHEPDRLARSETHLGSAGLFKPRGRRPQRITAGTAPCGPPTLDRSYVPTMLLLHVPNCLAAGLKSIAVAHPKGETMVLALDTSDPKPTIKQPDPLPQVAVGSKRVLKLTGSNLGMVQDVQFKGNTVLPEIAADKSYISILLPDEISTVPGFYVLTAAANDKAKTQIPVVVTIVAAPKQGG